MNSCAIEIIEFIWKQMIKSFPLIRWWWWWCCCCCCCCHYQQGFVQIPILDDKLDTDFWMMRSVTIVIHTANERHDRIFPTPQGSLLQEIVHLGQCLQRLHGKYHTHHHLHSSSTVLPLECAWFSLLNVVHLLLVVKQQNWLVLYCDCYSPRHEFHWAVFVTGEERCCGLSFLLSLQSLATSPTGKLTLFESHKGSWSKKVDSR